jgi:ubiquitin carboxyl-terminal hydrolase 7
MAGVLTFRTVDLTSPVPSLSVSPAGSSSAIVATWSIDSLSSEDRISSPSLSLGPFKIILSLTRSDDFFSVRITFSGFRATVHSNYAIVISDPEFLSQGTVSISQSARSLTVVVPFALPVDSGFSLTLELAVQNCRECQLPSKVTTDHVGLRNQSATCYLNSVIQALFHIPAFRALVFRMPTTGKEDATSIPLTLQKLFWSMQTGGPVCATTALTASFGWTREDAGMQQDAQEFFCVLVANLEEKMQNTKPELAVELQRLFRGEVQTVIRCINVDCSSVRNEYFYDLCLDVKGFATLIDAVRNQVGEERLEGNNQYETNDFGKQDAIMSKHFVSFPDVLQVHLRRFEFKGRMVKVTDAFEFPPVLDLSSIAPTRDGKVNMFELFAVLTHAGLSGGHYSAFIRTSKEPTWYKFNDEKVTIEDSRTAIEGNYGNKRTAASAYLLIYIRQSEIERIFGAVTDIPDHIKTYTSPGEPESLVNVSLYDRDALKDPSTRSSTGVDETKMLAKFELPRATRGTDLYQKVADKLGILNGSFRLWKIPFLVIPRTTQWTLGSSRTVSASTKSMTMP